MKNVVRLGLGLGAVALVFAAWSCGETGRCARDEDCPENQTCSFGGCRTACPCPVGQQCAAGLCYPAACNATACSNGEVCLGSTCGAPACAGESCAERSLFCDPDGGSCVGCVDNTQCSGLTPVCNPATHLCMCDSPGYEDAGAGQCANNDDDDCDTRVDCADSDCSAIGAPCGPGGATCQGSQCVCPDDAGVEAACGDSFDNDCDGFSDCADPDCNGVTCRAAAAGGCDVAETCGGSSSSCPPDVKRPNTHACRPAAGLCDVAEYCDGTTDQCPTTDAKQGAGFECRPVNGGCDIADTCDGISALCGERVVAGGQPCRPTEGQPCDVEERCDGVSPACPADQLADRTVVCRAAIADGGCDATEYCTGNSKACPDDRLVDAGTECRAGDLLRCDVAERCTGTSPYCPPNVRPPAGTVCRADAGPCDMVETCGPTGNCPADEVVQAGATCDSLAPTGSCDVPNTCNGIGKDCPETYAPATTPCRGSVPTSGGCDLEEYCTGSSPVCPPDLVADAGTPCSGDTEPCTVDRCTANGLCDTSVRLPNETPCAGGECCSGVCTDTTSDAANCGTCGTICTAPKIECCFSVCDTILVCNP